MPVEALWQAHLRSKTRTHMCPPPGSGLMPCCGRTPFEVARDDRITEDRSQVTCRGRYF